MSDKQILKHAADRTAERKANEAAESNPYMPVASSLDGAEATPDALGEWRGGAAELKGANNWVSLKSRPTSFGDDKNEHGNNSHLGPKPITHRQDQDFCEIHTDANGDFYLYNVETDKWDIKTNAQTIPFYEDENGVLWAFNYRTGAWDVPVDEVETPEDATSVSEMVHAASQLVGE